MRICDWSSDVCSSDLLSVAAASIVAKVTRDRLMAELALQHRGYGWEHNAGYGTRQHRNALEMRGVTPHHRLSFEPSSRYCQYYALQSQYIVDPIECLTPRLKCDRKSVG